jgi:hypothetical protein
MERRREVGLLGIDRGDSDRRLVHAERPFDDRVTAKLDDAGTIVWSSACYGRI